MSDTKRRKVKNMVWRAIRKFRDEAIEKYGPDLKKKAGEAKELVQEQLLGLLIAAIAGGIFSGIDDALDWLREQADVLRDPD